MGFTPLGQVFGVDPYPIPQVGILPWRITPGTIFGFFWKIPLTDPYPLRGVIARSDLIIRIARVLYIFIYNIY